VFVVCGLLGVSKEHRRKGLASLLLKHVLDMADREGKKTYLDATDEGWFVYSKLGFEVVGTVEIDLRKWGGEGVGRNRNMIREPRKIS
jgi:GNAT superfamily N-acetyltransferase